MPQKALHLTEVHRAIGGWLGLDARVLLNVGLAGSSIYTHVFRGIRTFYENAYQFTINFSTIDSNANLILNYQ